MPNKLLVTAANYEPKKVPCTFAVTADGKALAAVGPAQQIYDIPAGTAEVDVTATPTVKNLYWPTTISLTVAGNGSMSPQAGSSAWVTVTAATGHTSGVTQATINMTRFRDKQVSDPASSITDQVLHLLQDSTVLDPRDPYSSPPPGQGAPGKAELIGTYGTWPPADWAVKPVSNGLYLDRAAPWNHGALDLNFMTGPSLTVEVENVVLEFASAWPPRLYGVTWPTAIAPKDGTDPPPILLFLRQTCGQDADNGVFTGGTVATTRYPYNFDYAERCLFESLHYGDAPAWKAPPLFRPKPNEGWTLRPKGVPYQVAASGAGDKVVTVFPVAAVGKEYGVLNDMTVTGKILQELQAFMFWRAGVHTPPKSLGPTMIAAFSSTNYQLAKWLLAPKNRTSTSNFLKNTVRAIYCLDPPDVFGCVNAALSWADWAGADKRIRLYSRKPETDRDPKKQEAENKIVLGAFRKLLGSKPGDPTLPPDPPYVLNSPDGTRTVACLSAPLPHPTATWERAFKSILGESVSLGWWDVHHIIAAMVLTHALAQGDI